MNIQSEVLVSICCVTYNHEKYIRQCLDGFVMQNTNFIFEILVHEDASTDNTANIIREYEQQYPQLFRCVFQTENQFYKQNTLINILFPMARGKYIALCEGDDYWIDPLKLQKQIDFLETNSDFAICFHNVLKSFEDTDEPDQYYHPRNIKDIWTIEDLCRFNFIPTCSVVYRNNLFPTFPDWFGSPGDWLLYFLNARYGKIKYLDEVMGVYRIHAKSFWASQEKKNRLFVLNPTIKMLENINEYFNFEYNDLISITLNNFYNEKLYLEQQQALNQSQSSTELNVNELNNSQIKDNIYKLKLPKKDKLLILESINYLEQKPIISIILPVYNPKAKYLREALESVLNQTYPHWELCIADDSSTKPYVREILIEYAQKDNRIKVMFRQENGHISRASNTALEIATGEYITLLDHDDLLAPDALSEVVKLLNEHPEADMIYSDEDKIDENNTHKYPYLKPDWCPETFWSTMYTCHLGVYRRSIIQEIGGFRVGYEGSQDYDLVLRVTEKTDKIFHIPKILYHWRLHSGSASANFDSKPYAFEAGRKAIQSAMDRRGQNALVRHVDNKYCGYYEIDYQITNPDLVTIIIPTKDLGEILDQCLESVFTKTEYPHYEVIIIDNGSFEQKTQEIFKKWQEKEVNRFIVHQLDIPFNFSAINNFGAKKAQGKYLLFLNNDTEIITGNWLTKLVAQSQNHEIGAVGALLLYPDNTVQHSGIIVRVASKEGDIAINDKNKYQAPKNCAAVTAACLMCRKEVFEEVGGFDETLAVAYNDVDLCLKFHQQGYRNVVIPQVKLYHYESKTRGYEDTPAKKARLQKETNILRSKWENIFLYDYSQPYEVVSSNLVNNNSVSVIVIWDQNIKSLSWWQNNLKSLGKTQIIFVNQLNNQREKQALQTFSEKHKITLIEVNSKVQFIPKNEAIKIASGEYLLFLDNSINILQLPLKYIINLARNGIAGYGEVTNEFNIPYVQSWALCAKKSVLEALGGWDEEYDDSDWADMDLCYRAKLVGYPIFAIPEMSQWITRINK